MTVQHHANVGRPEFAYYYPAAHWYTDATSDWVKTLLLFFDGVATLVPYDMRKRVIEDDPAVAGVLVDQGLLQLLNTDDVLYGWRRDRDAAKTIEEYIDALEPALAEEPYEPLETPHILSVSKIPFAVRGFLKQRGLARSIMQGPTSEQLLVPRSVWRIVLTALAQHVSDAEPHGLESVLLPVTDQLDCVSILESRIRFTRAAVVASDLGMMRINVSAVPIDEVLAFRRQYGTEFRQYRRQLNQYVIQASMATFDQRAQMERDRQEELRDIQSTLEDRARPLQRLTQGAAFFLGMLGGGIQMAAGDHAGGAGGMVGAFGSLFGGGGERQHQGGYTYLFRAAKDFPQGGRVRNRVY